MKMREICIAENPEAYAKVIDEAPEDRSAEVPYALFYVIERDAIVIACIHAKRSPALAKEAVRGALRIPDPERLLGSRDDRTKPIGYALSIGSTWVFLACLREV
jgi:hypothetical protein